MRILNSMQQLPAIGSLFVYGTGGAGQALHRRMTDSGFTNIAFLDSFNSGDLNGVKIHKFSEYVTSKSPDDIVIIASTYENQIAAGLRQAGILNYFLYRDTRQFYLCRAICDLLPSEQTFQLLDIGARDPLSQAFWAPLEENRIRLHGFEPDRRECDLINKIFSGSPLSLTCYPEALWSEACEVPFWYCEPQPENSSALPIDFHYYDRWQVLDNGVQRTQGSAMRPVRKLTMRATTLADWARQYNAPPMDFAKLDTQGGELNILNGGWSVVQDMLGVILEASFVESYRGRPLFGDIDASLRKHGFHFFDFYRNNFGSSGWSVLLTK